MRIGQYHTHPAADVFPPLEGAALEALVGDVKEHGLREPITLADYNGTDRVLDGRNRLRACLRAKVAPRFRSFTKGSPTAYVVSLNLKRRNLTASQATACAAEMLPFFEAEAKARMLAGKKANPEAPGPQGRQPQARDEAGAAFGVSGRSVSRAKELASKAPELFEAVKAGKLEIKPALKAASMSSRDRERVLRKLETGKARDGRAAVRQVQRDHAVRKIASEPTPLPTGPFRVIVADPPWPYEKRVEDGSHRGALTYPPMSIEEICALKVGALGGNDSILWLWTTNAFMRPAFRVLDAWGYQEKTILTWCKQKMGNGDWLRGKTEHCILAVKGSPTVKLTNQTTELHGDAREHSRKPESFYELVEALCPGSKIELFARTPRKDWQTWGAEASKFKSPS